MAGMLEGKDHAALYSMRRAAPRGDQLLIAPAEHRAFAREWAQESPVLAGASLPFAIPAYQLAKLLGLQKARTPASIDELFAGYHGLAEGMLARMVPSAQAADGGVEQLTEHELRTLLAERRGLDQAAEAEREARVLRARPDTTSDATRRLQLLWRAIQGDRPAQYDLRTPGAPQWDEEGMLARPARKTPAGRVPGMPSPYRG